ncbi:DEAD/DEAH box helicase [Paralysiella testudinis]|uniref:SNF2 helicase associated domain-containing protein n=1 Tax=Paralysiella testudinis TaxID=2809020 RepID=A0A892ZHX9_9NEIS|nr:DEAD/DEAH box helicase [Paralysiella testudinis]QRQ82048.1 SNF2 helicase associated domain-containing protein [Paralysiella testudinis]
MANVHTRDLIDYIRQNAASSSLAKAKLLQPQLERLDGEQAVYTCKGSSRKPYVIVINYEYGRIQTMCTCPYDHEGICKHTVASLRALVDYFNRVGSTALPETAKPAAASAQAALSYPLTKQGLLDLAAIEEKLRLEGFHYNKQQHAQSSSCELVKLEPGDMVLEAESWYGRNRQQWRLLPQQNCVEISCDCTQKYQGKYCQHVVIGLQFVADNLGADCLSADYANHKIAAFLQAYGLTLSDDYQRFFTFGFDAQGFTVEHKMSGLQPLDYTVVAEDTPALPAHLYPATLPEYTSALVVEFSGRTLQGLTCVEGKYDKKRTDLATSIRALSYYSSAETLVSGRHSPQLLQMFWQSEQVNKHYQRYRRQQKNQDLQQAQTAFARLCAELTDCRLFAHRFNQTYVRKNLQPLSLNTEDKVSLLFKLEEDALCYTLSAKIKIGSRSYLLHSNQLTITPLFVRRQDEILPLDNLRLTTDLLDSIQQPQKSFLKQNSAHFQQHILQPLSCLYEIEGVEVLKIPAKTNRKTAKKQPLPTAAATTAPPAKQVYISEQEGWVFFRLAMQYADKLIQVHSNEMRLLPGADGTIRCLPRDTEAEAELVQLFESLHPDFAQGNGLYVLSPAQLSDNFWLLEAAEQLQSADIALLGTHTLTSFNYNLNKPSVAVRLASGTDWFDMHINISFGNQQVQLKDVQKAFLKKQNYVVLGDGSIGMLPQQWMAQFAQYFQAGEIKKNHLQISNHQFGIIDELYQSLNEKPAFLVDLYQRKQRLQNLGAQSDIPVPKGIEARLRPYQQHGLNWLVFLHQNRLGGCLADDMGLGKTLQTITFLQYLKQTEQPQQPTLIVAPTTLVFNWQDELAKFCPSLKVLNFTGAARSGSLSELSQYDIVLTTYGSLLRDIDELKEIAFYYAILDESQAIKNPQSQRYKAVRLLKAHNRLILTGTPIENNTFDLYAQFNFINPGLLGSSSHFKSAFAEAIDKNKDADTSALLARLVNPFILRRTKTQVATELPPKIESILYCEMGKKQRQVYEAFKQRYRDYLLNKIDENGIAKAQLYILEGLMKLRQICNSPALLSDDADYGDESVKLDMLVEHIKEKTGQHKILVFSSFVKMLQLIQTRLQAENIECEYLDGQTRNRREKVANFQTNADVRVFLISTKAGGTGLNLTEADYVLIVDPWWNPAVENQAIDRSYRIGQTRHVMAYRMICKDSIEEKILALQQSKKTVAESIISVDEEKKSFDLNEVKKLFA